MGKKTVADFGKFKKEVGKLTEPKGFDKATKEVKKLFDNWSKGDAQILVEIHFDDSTNTITEVKSRLGNSKVDFWP